MEIVKEIKQTKEITKVTGNKKIGLDLSYKIQKEASRLLKKYHTLRSVINKVIELHENNKYMYTYYTNIKTPKHIEKLLIQCYKKELKECTKIADPRLTDKKAYIKFKETKKKDIIYIELIKLINYNQIVHNPIQL